MFVTSKPLLAYTFIFTWASVAFFSCAPTKPNYRHVSSADMNLLLDTINTFCVTEIVDTTLFTRQNKSQSGTTTKVETCKRLEANTIHFSGAFKKVSLENKFTVLTILD